MSTDAPMGPIYTVHGSLDYLCQCKALLGRKLTEDELNGQVLAFNAGIPATEFVANIIAKQEQAA